MGHTDIVRWVTFNADGTLFASGGHDKTIRVWNIASGNLLSTLQGHTERVTRVLFDQHNNIWSASGDSTIKRWNLETGVADLTLQGHVASVTSLIFTDQDAHLLSAGVDGKLWRWDLETGKGQALGDIAAAPILDLTYSTDGKKIVSASSDWTARIWDTATGKLQITLRGHENAVSSAVFSQNGQHVLTASTDGSVRVWDSITGAQISKFVLTLDGKVRQALYSSDERAIIAALGLKTVLIDVQTGAVIRTFESTIGDTWRLAVSPNGKYIALAGLSYQGVLEVFDLKAKAGIPSHIIQLNSRAQDFAFSLDSNYLSFTSLSGELAIWDVLANKEYKKFTKGIAGITGNNINLSKGAFGALSVAYSPDGSRLLTSSRDSTLRIWNIATGLVEQQYHIPSLVPFALIYSPDGKKASAADFDGVIRTWWLGARPEVLEFGSNSTGAFDIDISDDDSKAAIVGDTGISIWDAKTGLQTKISDISFRSACAFSPNGQLLATIKPSSDHQTGTIELWDSENLNLQQKIVLPLGGVSWGIAFAPEGDEIAVTGHKGEGWILSTSDLSTRMKLKELPTQIERIHYSLDGRYLLVANADGTARSYSTQDGALLRTYRWKLGLRDAQYSPDGEHIVVAAEEGAVVIFDAETSAIVRILSSHSDEATSASYSPDGKRIVSTSLDGTAKLWDAETGELRSTTKPHASSLTKAVFTHDSNRVVTLGIDGIAEEYFVNIADLRQLAEQRVSRPLSQEEQNQFLPSSKGQ